MSGLLTAEWQNVLKKYESCYEESSGTIHAEEYKDRILKIREI